MSSRESADEKRHDQKCGSRRKQKVKPAGEMLAQSHTNSCDRTELTILKFTGIDGFFSRSLSGTLAIYPGYCVQKKGVCECSVHKTLIPVVSGSLPGGNAQETYSVLNNGPARSSVLHANCNLLYMPFLPSTNGAPRPVSQTE